MKTSSIVAYCAIIILMVCFFFKSTGIASFPVSSSSSLCIILKWRAPPRKLLSIDSTQRYRAGSTQSSTDQKVQSRVISSKSGHQDDDDDDLIYHIDYRGVMTHHPAPTPRHH